jgi:dethiobiotin synthetase
MNRRLVFVTGTDTGVGKTVVTAALAAGLRANGEAVTALKPVASGVEPGTFGDDAARIARAAGHEPACFAAYAAALSPHLAAEREGLELDRVALLAWIRQRLSSWTLVEGVGGWEVPIRRDYRISDLARELDADVVIVARNRIGMLNHGLLTLNAVRARGCRLCGVVVTRPDGSVPDDSTASNVAELRSLTDSPVAEMPWIDPEDTAALLAAGAGLREALLLR